MSTTTQTAPYLSHSQVTEFLMCPMKYHLHRRLRIPPAFRPSCLVFGCAVHEALAYHQQRRLEGKATDAKQLWSIYRQCWQTPNEIPIQLKEGEDEKALLEKAGDMLDCYLEHMTESGQVIAVEEPFMLRLTDDLPTIRGRVDLVERHPNGRLLVTDFKTAGRRGEPDASQLVLYRVAIAAMTGEPVEAVDVRYTVLLKTKNPDIVHYAPKLTEEHTQRLVRLYAEAWHDIELGCRHPNPGWQCAGCPWSEECGQA